MLSAFIKGWLSWSKLYILIALVIGIVFWYWQWDNTITLQKQTKSLQDSLIAYKSELTHLQQEYYLQNIPLVDSIEFAGNQYVLDQKTAIDLMWTIAMFKNYRHWLVTINVNYYSYQGLDTVLAEYDVHADWLYLAAAESFLQQFVRSYKGATGLWQFMVGRAKENGLKVYYGWDERRDVFRSTEAAGKGFSKLLKKYDGNMMLMSADWNWGPGSLKNMLRKSEADYFFNLPVIPNETYQYVLNVLAIAYLFKVDIDFMKQFDSGFRYNFPKVEILQVYLRRNLNVQDLLYFYDNSFSLFYTLNSPINIYNLPAGRRFDLHVPVTAVDTLASFLKTKKFATEIISKKGSG